MRKLRRMTTDQYAGVIVAVTMLREARDMLKRCACPQATNYVRRAIKSAEGARRHGLRRLKAEGRA